MSEIIRLFLVLGLVATPCTAFFFDDPPPECNRRQINHHTEICCNKELFEKPSDWLDVQCCLNQIYDAKTHYCCFLGLFRAELAPVIDGKSREFSCHEALEKVSKSDRPGPLLRLVAQ